MKPFARSSSMVALSWGIEAEMLGSLMTLASGLVDQAAELGEVVGDPLLGSERVGEGGEHPAGERDVAQLDLDPGDVGEGVDHREEGAGGEGGGLVGEGVDDGVAVGHGRFPGGGGGFADSPETLLHPSRSPPFPDRARGVRPRTDSADSPCRSRCPGLRGTRP